MAVNFKFLASTTTVTTTAIITTKLYTYIIFQCNFWIIIIIIIFTLTLLSLLYLGIKIKAPFFLLKLNNYVS